MVAALGREPIAERLGVGPDLISRMCSPSAVNQVSMEAALVAIELATAHGLPDTLTPLLLEARMRGELAERRGPVKARPKRESRRIA